MSSRARARPHRPGPSPNTLPAAAVSLMSPPPMPSGCNNAAMSRGSAAKMPNSRAGWKETSPVAAVSRQMVLGTMRFWQSRIEAHANVPKNHAPCSMKSAVIVEHLLYALGHGGEDCVPKQSVQAGKKQGAQHHGNQNFDGSVDVALASGVG